MSNETDQEARLLALETQLKKMESRLEAVEEVDRECPGQAVQTVLLDHGDRIYKLEMTKSEEASND